MLTPEQIVYGQQKNREYIWTQAREEVWDFKRKLAKIFNQPLTTLTEEDIEHMDNKYIRLCKQANITPW